MEYCDSKERMAKTKEEFYGCAVPGVLRTHSLFSKVLTELTHMNDGNLKIMVIPNIILH